MAPHLPDSLKTYYMGKSKLTAVCSHYASIGNVGAPLSISISISIFVKPEVTDQTV